MTFHRLLFLIFCPIVPGLLTAIGCSKPILKMPKALPPIVKQYKHMTLTPAPGMRNTGIYLNNGDLYSILATGSIDMGSRGPGYRVVRPEHSWPLMARIGKEAGYFQPLFYANAATINAPYSGYLYLGIREGRVDEYGRSLTPGHYDDDTGYFRVDVVVWKEEDFVEIADFLEEMKEKDPENPAIIYALKEATHRKDQMGDTPNK